MKGLRKARLMKDITQQELGDRIGISRKTINMYENGKKLPRFETLIKLSDELQVSLDFLVGRD